MPFRVIVCGDRHLADYALVAEKLDYYLSGQQDVAILSGGAPGADSLAERYALERGIHLERHPADWAAHGRSAGPRRNRKMASIAEACIAFDGGGPGTKNMLAEARRKGLAIRVVLLPHKD